MDPNHGYSVFAPNGTFLGRYGTLGQAEGQLWWAPPAGVKAVGRAYGKPPAQADMA
jgi:hypothetical protein